VVLNDSRAERLVLFFVFLSFFCVLFGGIWPGVDPVGVSGRYRAGPGGRCRSQGCPAACVCARLCVLLLPFARG
jgi:hypothetical protein